MALEDIVKKIPIIGGASGVLAGAIYGTYSIYSGLSQGLLT